MTRRSLSKDYRGPFRELFNAAWSKNWGYSPYSDADIKSLAEEAQLAYTKEWMMKAVDRDGEVVGMAITIPDLNQLLVKMNGKLFPTGIFTFLFGSAARRSIGSGSLPRVQPDRQHTGAAPRCSTASTSRPRTARRCGRARWAGSSRPTSP